jgi:hypothetical protein
MPKHIKPAKPSPQKQKLNRELVYRALTDRKFRKALEGNPREALGRDVTDLHRREIRLVLAAVRGIEAQIKAVGDELLCLNGPCGIAAV